MKRHLRLTILLICLAMPLAAWARTTLHYAVTGIDNPALKNVQSALQNLQGNLTYPLNQNSAYTFYMKAPLVIKKALQPYGYFHPTINSRIAHNRGTWIVGFHITPGRVMHISKITLLVSGDGQHDKSYQHYLHRLPLKIGDALNTDKYEKIKESLFQRASNRGYFKAKLIKSKITINFKTYTAQIFIHFNTGPRYKFGATFFSHVKLYHHFLKKFLAYKEGEYYNYKKIQTSQRNLTNSGYFLQVFISPKPKQAKNSIVPIHVLLVTRKPKRYTFGAGYGTDTGVRGTIGLDINRVNYHGHQFHTLLQGSKNNSSLVASYIIPGCNPVTDHFAITGGYGFINQDSGDSRAGKLSLSYTKDLGWFLQTISLTYLDENYDIINLPKTQANLIFPSIYWHFLHVNDKHNPTSGISADIKLAGTPNALASTNGFFQARLDARALYTLPTHTRFLLRGSAGHTIINNLNGLPLSLQLFAGGARSIRGYSYNAIGPGRNMLVGSVELQQKITGSFYLAGFIDAGNVTNSNLFDNFNIGVGPALAVVSPLGTIEVGAAKPIIINATQPLTKHDKEWRFVFSMGPVL